MNMSKLTAARLSFALLLPITLAAPEVGVAQPTSLTLSLGESAATVSNVPPGHDVLIFGVSREVDGYALRRARHEHIVSAAPGSRTATYDLATPIAGNSIWVAIDLQNGDFDIKAASGYRLRLMVDVPTLRRDAAGALVGIAHERAEALILLVTPGRGAWLIHSGDGGKSDLDPRPGHGLSSFSDLRPLDSLKNGPPAPSRLTPNDVIVVIDPIYMDVWSGRVGREVQP